MISCQLMSVMLLLIDSISRQSSGKLSAKLKHEYTAYWTLPDKDYFLTKM